MTDLRQGQFYNGVYLQVSEFYLECAPGKANPFESFIAVSHHFTTNPHLTS